jgi:ABC-type branched-subunit amino acid transport system permease subunit
MRPRVGLVITALVALALPFALNSPYYVLLLDMILVNAIATLGLQLIHGYAGQLSIAHAAYFGIGAYTTAILTTRIGVPVVGGLLAATVVAAAFTVLMSPLVVLRGHYFAMGTFGFMQMASIVFLNWSDLTGGANGINKIPAPALAGIALSDPFGMYWVLLIVGVMCVLFTRRVIDSRFGRTLVAIRENEIAAAAAGISPATAKVKVIIIGNALAGLAGALFAHLVGYVGPANFTFDASVLFLTMLVVGGRSPIGALIGSACITLLPEMLRQLPGYSSFPTLRMIAFGLLLVLLTGFLRFGIGGLVQEAFDRWRRRAWGRNMPAAPSVGGAAG